MRLIFTSFLLLSISQTAADDPFTCLTFNASCMSAAVKMLWPSLQYLRIAPFIGLMMRSQTSLPDWGSEKSYLYNEKRKCLG